jgi:hypothetical protein
MSQTKVTLIGDATTGSLTMGSGETLTMDGLATKVAAGDVIFQGGIVAGVSLTNGTSTLLNFSTEGYDRGNNFASGAFTAPKDGVYFFHAGFRPSNFAVDRLIIQVFKNDSNIGGTAISNTGEGKAQSGHYPFIQVSNMYSLSANDTIKHYGYQNSGGDQDIFQQTLMVVRLGTFD